MIPSAITRFTRFLCPDFRWPTEAQEAAGHLVFRDEESVLGPVMVSEWEITPDELARLNAGAKIVLTILGKAHPHVALDVSKEPAEISEGDLVHAA